LAAQTWFLDPSSGFGGLSITDPGAEATSSTGWTVAKTAPTVYSLMSNGVERAAGTFGATAVPNGTSNPDGADSMISPLASPISGTYDAGTWTASFKVIGVSSGGDADGLIRAALWRCDSAFTTFTLLAGPTEGGTVTNLATATSQASTVSFAGVAAKTLTSEHLVLQVGWKITGAGGATSRDVLLRVATGITLVTPNFTVAAAGNTYTKAGFGKENG
jgi:hypothetical protein